ncbi:MAG: alanine--glyoxylate aminotransferase family protein [Gemmatimonadales bacterium]|nr:MAG: alanine--glyoxylate aminotransferase family protein [Gemmatimonadales bacterium]
MPPPPLIRALPGPTALHPVVPSALQEAVSSGLGSEPHRGARARREIASTAEALRALLGIPEDHHILHLGSATEAMERIAAGVLPTLRTPGARSSLHLVAGAFAQRFLQVARALDRPALASRRPEGRGFDARTALEIPPDAPRGAGEPPALVALCQNETSTGARTPPTVVDTLARRARGLGALVAVDLVSGWPSESVDPSLLDAAFFSVQKGFGMPAGLGVLVASPALVEAARRQRGAGLPIGGWIDLEVLARRATRHETAVTPNLLLIAVLGRVAEAYLEEGREALAARMEARARHLRDAVRRAPLLRPVVPDSLEAERSRTILALEGSRGQSLAPVRQALLEEGIQVAAGYGEGADARIRIANYPSLSDAEMETVAEGIPKAAERAAGGAE